MGWQSDWLYQVIFKNIQKAWEEVLKDGQTEMGPAPDYCIVSQFSEFKSVPWQSSLLMATSAGPIIKRWKLDSVGVDRITGAQVKEFEIPHKERGAFYRVGKINFCISDDRRIVSIGCNFGPRYGTERVYRVQGQGKHGQLSGHPDFVWFQY